VNPLQLVGWFWPRFAPGCISAGSNKSGRGETTAMEGKKSLGASLTDLTEPNSLAHQPDTAWLEFTLSKDQA